MFTSKERDAETGLDFMEARYYGSAMGRVHESRSDGRPPGHLDDPQTLNRYVYARNNPLTFSDPTGLDFYLQCAQTKDNASTCQSQQVGTDNKGKAINATVQGVTGDDGFKATRVGNDANGALVDKTTGTGSYTASFDGKTVSLNELSGARLSRDVVAGKCGHFGHSRFGSVGEIRLYLL